MLRCDDLLVGVKEIIPTNDCFWKMAWFKISRSCIVVLTLYLLLHYNTSYYSIRFTSLFYCVFFCVHFFVISISVNIRCIAMTILILFTFLVIYLGRLLTRCADVKCDNLRRYTSYSTYEWLIERIKIGSYEKIVEKFLVWTEE